jgi:peptide/nickel transport system ATP-binding protein
MASPSRGIAGGEILWRGRDLLLVSETEMRKIRGNEIGMIFQEPMTSLNPVFTIGDQIGEAIRLHQGTDRRETRRRAVDMLRLVEIPEPERRVDEYPHQLSGGMRQRVMIAMALSCNPKLLIADEPTTALDVTIQAQILDLLAELRERLGMALLLITHDLGIVAEQADEVAIFYAGRIVEHGTVEDVFLRPAHPYTRGLLASVPKVGRERERRLHAIPGTVPSLTRLPAGCRFRDRCPIAIAACATVDPALEPVEPGHVAACIRANERVENHPGEGAIA